MIQETLKISSNELVYFVLFLKRKILIENHVQEYCTKSNVILE